VRYNLIKNNVMRGQLLLFLFFLITSQFLSVDIIDSGYKRYKIVQNEGFYSSCYIRGVYIENKIIACDFIVKSKNYIDSDLLLLFAKDIPILSLSIPIKYLYNRTDYSSLISILRSPPVSILT
jgi:hypothetical protein